MVTGAMRTWTAGTAEQSIKIEISMTQTRKIKFEQCSEQWQNHQEQYTTEITAESRATQVYAIAEQQVVTVRIKPKNRRHGRHWKGTLTTHRN
jgi:uncharacterized protein YeaO (DUF488 family)